MRDTDADYPPKMRILHTPRTSTNIAVHPNTQCSCMYHLDPKTKSAYLARGCIPTPEVEWVTLKRNAQSQSGVFKCDMCGRKVPTAMCKSFQNGKTLCQLQFCRGRRHCTHILSVGICFADDNARHYSAGYPCTYSAPSSSHWSSNIVHTPWMYHVRNAFMCKQHCIARGGCQVKLHTTSKVPLTTGAAACAASNTYFWVNTAGICDECFGCAYASTARTVGGRVYWIGWKEMERAKDDWYR